MEFFTVRDLRTTPKNVWENLSKQGELVITNNGKPMALMLNIENDLEEVLAAVRQAQVMRAVNDLREEAQRNKSIISEEEIEAEIAEVRKEIAGC